MCRQRLIACIALALIGCSSSSNTGDDTNAVDGSNPNFATNQQDGAGSADTQAGQDAGVGPITADTAAPPCEEGKACNDGDLCTKNDVCTGGVCQGAPITCAIDPGAPCASAACVDGVCLQTIDDGFCYIDGDCFTQGQPNGDCQRCLPGTSSTDWSDNSDGTECQGATDDPCVSSTCQQGACVDAPVLCDEDDGNPCTEHSCVGGTCEYVEQSGTECDDGDPCTSEDICDKGNCIGGGVDCDDGLSCTADACSADGCAHEITAGFCAIDGMCLANGETNPQNPCQLCDATTPTTWQTVADGTPCEDGSNCTSSDTCQAGACVGGASLCPDDGNPCTVSTCDNNLCDMVDAAMGTPCDDGDPCTIGDSCTAGQCLSGEVDATCGGCTYHADCYPKQICGNWYTTGTQECSDPCAGDSDCPVGFICSKVPGSVQAGYCEPTIGSGGQGAPCEDGTTCSTGLCVDSKCAGGCLDDNHCTDNLHTCQMIGDLAGGYVGTACTADGALKQSGVSCSNDGVTWDSLQCASGHCDLSAPIDQPAVCSNTCTSQNDCSPGQMCGLVFHGAPPIGVTTNPDSIPYHPEYTQPTYDAIAGCHTSLNGLGDKSDSVQCTQNNECQSGHCLPLIPGNETRFCTRMCSLDSDCQGTMQCKMEVVNLTSGWLEAQGTNNISAMSLVRICKFP